MIVDGPGLRRHRENMGLSQADLAKASGLSRSFVSQLESGQRGASPPVVAGLAGLLSIEIDDLRTESLTTCSECGRRVSYIDELLR